MKKWPLIGFVCVILVVCFGYFIASQTVNLRALASAKLTYYKPTHLPAGINIVRKTLFEQKYQSGGDPFGKILTNTSITLSYRMVDNVYSINESTFGSDDKQQILASDGQNYDPTSKKPTCKQVTTPGSKLYRLCHWVDYDKYSVYETKFFIGDEFIDSRMETDLSRTLNKSELNAFVDSFVKSDPNELTLDSYTGGP